MTRGKRKTWKGLLKLLLLLLPVMDIPPRPPGKTRNPYQIINRRKREQGIFVWEKRGEIRLVTQEKPAETSAENEEVPDIQDEEL